MGIEGGSNNEVQSQEINQANNEQNRIDKIAANIPKTYQRFLVLEYK